MIKEKTADSFETNINIIEIKRQKIQLHHSFRGFIQCIFDVKRATKPGTLTDESPLQLHTRDAIYKYIYMMCVRGVQKAQVLKNIYIKTAAYMTKIGQKLTDDIFCVCVWYTVVDFFGEHKKCKSLPRINRSR